MRKRNLIFFMSLVPLLVLGVDYSDSNADPGRVCPLTAMKDDCFDMDPTLLAIINTSKEIILDRNKIAENLFKSSASKIIGSELATRLDNTEQDIIDYRDFLLEWLMSFVLKLVNKTECSNSSSSIELEKKREMDQLFLTKYKYFFGDDFDEKSEMWVNINEKVKKSIKKLNLVYYIDNLRKKGKVEEIVRMKHGDASGALGILKAAYALENINKS